MFKRAGKTSPNLFIVGAPKCGTTAWVSYLASHPEIYFAEMKEPNFFATDFPRMRWVSSQREYDTLFSRAGNANVVGEASALYLYSTEAAQRIRKSHSDARILIFLRDQEQFLPALHHQLLYRFAENIENFDRAWRLSKNRPPETIPKTCRDAKLLDYASFGRFGEQVSRYFDCFAPEQIHIVQFDKWVANPREAYLEILGFLRLQDDGRTHFPQVNEAKFYRNPKIGKLIAHPPWIARLAARTLRTITGRSALGIGVKASELLAAKGYRTIISPEIRSEISRYYADDRLMLNSLIRRHELKN